ncbi:PaaI family thioesterase [Cryptosporangium arvum]|uniref:PaaI family thioesterase n=1 Tax=Cryptosporangium arvum TaxID=80871 RepID=UPI0004B1B81A|nr:PaaI family thioesterase [Cryptosporangium arvum]
MTTTRPGQSDPSALHGRAGLSGLELIRAIATGEAPPPNIAQLLGMQMVEADEGRVVFTLDTRREFSNPLGTVHGGIHATLLDSAMGCAVHTTLPAGVGYTTLELKVNYVKAITLDAGTLTCVGEVIHVGGRVATADGRVTDSAGKLLAHATTTCMIFR